MSIPCKPGVYLLCSADSFGKRVYKVGRSENLKQRLASYPPNFMVLGIFPCELHEEMESKIIGAFREKFKVYARNEYFDIDAPYEKISGVFYSVISNPIEKKVPRMVVKKELPKKEIKKPEPKELVSKSAEKKEIKKPEIPKKEIKKSVIQELKTYVLETHEGAITRKEMEDSVKSYNTLITYIMQRRELDEKEKLLNGVVVYLKEIVPNKEVKKYKEELSCSDLKLVSRNHLIKTTDVDKLYK